MQFAEFTRRLSQSGSTVFGTSAVDQATRALRSAGILENPGRGRPSPEATPRDVTAFLIGTAASVSGNAAKHLSEVGPLFPTHGDAFHKGASFAETMASILETPALANLVTEIEIGTDVSFARIVLAPSEPDGAARTVVYGKPQAARRSLTLSGGLISQMALDLQGQDARNGEWSDADPLGDDW